MNRRDFLSIATVSPLIILSKEANAWAWLFAAAEFIFDCLVANTERAVLFSGLAVATEAATAAGIISRVSAVSRLNRGISVIGSVEKAGFIAAERAIKATAKLSQAEKERMLNVLKVGETAIDLVSFVEELESVNPSLANDFVDAVNTKKEISAVWKTDHSNSIVVPFENKSNSPIFTSLTVTLKDVGTGEHEFEKSFLMKADANSIGVYSIECSEAKKQGLKMLSVRVKSNRIKAIKPKLVFMV